MPRTRCVFANATRVFAAMFRALTASVTLTQVRWHHPRLPPSGNNLGTALRRYPLHVRLFAIRRAPSSAGAKPTSPA